MKRAETFLIALFRRKLQKGVQVLGSMRHER